MSPSLHAPTIRPWLIRLAAFVQRIALLTKQCDRVFFEGDGRLQEVGGACGAVRKRRLGELTRVHCERLILVRAELLRESSYLSAGSRPRDACQNASTRTRSSMIRKYA